MSTITFNDLEFTYENVESEYTDFMNTTHYLNATIVAGNDLHPSGSKVDKITIYKTINFTNNAEIAELERIEILRKEYEHRIKSYQNEGNIEMMAELNYELAELTKDTYYYNESAKLYSKENYKKAIDIYLKVIEIYLKEEKFHTAALRYKEIALLFESNNESENALTFYRNASNFYKLSDSKANLNHCLIKVAELTSDLNESAQIFEHVGLECLETKLGSFSAPKHFEKCLLCLLAIGNIDVLHNKVGYFSKISLNFTGSRQFIYICELISAWKYKNLEEFNNSYNSYNNITPHDNFINKVIDIIRRNF